MERNQVASRLLEALGGTDNIVANGVCATRLRIRVQDAKAVNEELINQVPGVLGCIRHGDTRVEIVFGPRYIESIYQAVLALTGIAPADESVPFKESGDVSSINIKISPAKQQSYAAQATFAHDHEAEDAEDGRTEAAASEEGRRSKQRSAHKADIAALKSILDRGGTRKEAPVGPRLLVINGPNINMLGIREPSIYGREDYSTLVGLCKRAATEYGFSVCECFQSNHEGDIVDKIQAAYQAFDGIVINPGAYTHTSVAILDALKAVSIPCVEVHISKVDEREEFRQVSYVRLACFETVMGLGLEGYRKAIRDLAEHLHEERADKD